VTTHLLSINNFDHEPPIPKLWPRHRVALISTTLSPWNLPITLCCR